MLSNKMLDKYNEHADYIRSIRDELNEAEATVKRIKKSKQFKSAMSYFNVLKVRGYLKDVPQMNNGYVVADLQPSYTPKQLFDMGIITEEQYKKLTE